MQNRYSNSSTVFLSLLSNPSSLDSTKYSFKQQQKLHNTNNKNNNNKKKKPEINKLSTEKWKKKVIYIQMTINHAINKKKAFRHAGLNQKLKSFYKHSYVMSTLRFHILISICITCTQMFGFFVKRGFSRSSRKKKNLVLILYVCVCVCAEDKMLSSLEE